MNINVITVGKLKEKYWRDACSEYCTRLSAFGKINIAELAESRLPSAPSEKEILYALSSEGKLMKPYLSEKSAFNIAMCIEGTQMKSEDLAQKIGRASVDGFSTLNIFIGSSFGLDDSVKKECAMRLSMSEMTFPHQLARVMVLEQLYRAFSILNNSKYHK